VINIRILYMNLVHLFFCWILRDALDQSLTKPKKNSSKSLCITFVKESELPHDFSIIILKKCIYYPIRANSPYTRSIVICTHIFCKISNCPCHLFQIFASRMRKRLLDLSVNGHIRKVHISVLDLHVWNCLICIVDMDIRKIKGKIEYFLYRYCWIHITIDQTT